MVPRHVRAGLVGRNQPATGGRLLAHALEVLLRWLVHLPHQLWSAHDDATEFHRTAAAGCRCGTLKREFRQELGSILSAETPDFLTR